jgi:hypothetical protein
MTTTYSEVDDWLIQERLSISEFLNSRITADFKVCFSDTNNDLPRKNSLLASYAFCARTLKIVGSLTKTQEQRFADAILKFKGVNGIYWDPYVKNNSWFIRTASGLKNLDLAKLTGKYYMIAETRQAIATLLTLGRDESTDCLYKFILENRTIENYLLTLNFKKPWHSNSHVNHLLFALRYHSKISEDEKKANAEKIIKITSRRFIDEINSGKLNGSQAIGGAMKLCMGAKFFDLSEAITSLYDESRFMSFAPNSDACEQFNYLYAISNLMNKKLAEYEVLEYLRNWRAYKKENGGYSFYRDKSSTVYMDAKITRSKNVADLHGTAMFSWGLVILDQLRKNPSGKFNEIIL